MIEVIRKQKTRSKREKTLYFFGLVMSSVLINMIGATIADRLRLPLYLDSIGTILAAALGGYIPGITVGLISPLINSLIADPVALSYGMLNVMIAVFVAWASEHGWQKKLSGSALTVLVLAFIGGVLGSVLTWILYGFAQESTTAKLIGFLQEVTDIPPFAVELIGDYLIDLLDKAISVGVVTAIIAVMPEKLRYSFHIHIWRQAPLTPQAVKKLREKHSRSVSLKLKITLMLSLASALVAISAIAISYSIYRDEIIRQETQVGEGVSMLVAATVEGDMVDTYISEGDTSLDYAIMESRLKNIKNTSQDIQYIYVYKIEEDGCHVVFDLDTEEVKGAEPGEVIPFDESFSGVLPILLSGGEIEPIITDDTYGWLLTVYTPIHASDGSTAAYAACDISMDRLKGMMLSFLMRQISLFFGIFVLIVAVGLYVAEYEILLPLNTMSLTASMFSDEKDGHVPDDSRLAAVTELFKRIDIFTGDEIENLYRSVSRMTEDNLAYVRDIREKNETINAMQASLIMVLADMVESRDQNTGDHIRKTAEYVRIILDEMKKEGIYADALTERFMEDVVSAAPLHDIGKISVSDVILNKPGKLTDEEFEIMKTHTTMGGKIIDQVIATVPEADSYLLEAKRLALYHHEKWDGRGYPQGLAGEDIPLSARIMAVADVFDALVSKRAYKKGFPFEKAIDIIRESSGSHFDPLVAGAFLAAEDRVREVADLHNQEYE